MSDLICLTCDAPESGIVLVAKALPTDFFDAALDELLTVGGEPQIETLNAAFSMELPFDFDTLSFWLSMPIELCTAITRRPWDYPALTLDVSG